MRHKKLNIIILRSHRETWRDVAIENMPLKIKSRFLKVKKAVDLYIDGFPVKAIEEETGINRQNITRFIGKCLVVDEYGNEYGYSALIPYSRPNSNILEKSGTGTGDIHDLADIFICYPSIKDLIYGCITGDPAFTQEKNIQFKTLHRRFLTELRKLGVIDQQYPFTDRTQGYYSLYRYVKKLKEEIRVQASILNKDPAQKLTSTGVHEVLTLSPVHPYATIQIDGHKLDVLYVTERVREDGTIEYVVCERMWLLVCIDMVSRAILGYYLTSHVNYDRFDVLKCMQRAILPKEKIAFTLPGLAYPESGGFPDTAFPELEYAIFNQVMMDNALSQISKDVKTAMDSAGIVLNFGSVATPETRGIVERFFRTLEDNGLHMLGNTTGSNANDKKRRQDAEKVAVRNRFTSDVIAEMMEYLICSYNNRPHSGIGNYTPIQFIFNNCIAAGMFPCIADRETIKAVKSFTYIWDTRMVRGNAEKGVRPYIEYENARYSGDVLSGSLKYLGDTVQIRIDPDCINELEVYSETGHYIDTVRARGKWSRSEHSLRVRRQAVKEARNRKGRMNDDFGLPIHDLEAGLNERAKKSRSDATKLEVLRKESSVKKPSEKAEAPVPESPKVIDFSEKVVEAKKPDSRDRSVIDEQMKNDLYSMTYEEFYKKYKEIL